MDADADPPILVLPPVPDPPPEPCWPGCPICAGEDAPPPADEDADAD